MSTQGIKTILIKVLGTRIVSFLHSIRFLFMLSSKQHTDPEFQLLGTLLRAGDVALDVGAHSANWTYRLHKAIGPSGRVYAFEADPYSAKATDLTIRLLRMKGVTLFPFGLSEREETVSMRVADDQGTRMAATTHVDRTATATDHGVVTIHLKKLDSLIDQMPDLLKTRLIKCDVEGYELFVFRGADQVLATARPFVILEVGMFEQQGYTAADILEFFQSRSYQPYVMVSPTQLSPTDDALNHPQALSVNRLFVPSEKVDVIDQWLAKSTVPNG